MMMGNVKQQVEDKGIITISDPSSGAGGTLIAAAYEVANQKIDPRSHAQFHATDVSRNCFNMTYLQLSQADVVFDPEQLSLFDSNQYQQE